MEDPVSALMVFKSLNAEPAGGLGSVRTIGYVQYASNVGANLYANTTYLSTNAGPAEARLFVSTTSERRNVKSAREFPYANMEGTNTNVETVEEN